MSFGAFYAGLSGLRANAGRLGVIGNNLANVNTIGFKASRVTFQDIFSQTGGGGGAGFNGAGNPQQVGLGVQVGGIDLLFNQGALQTTGLVTDVSIQGNGFFVLASGQGALSYSRAGNFTFDNNGNLVAPTGEFVQGYTTKDASGNILTSGALTNIRIPIGLTAPPKATTRFTSVTNLNADAKVDDAATTLNESEPFSSTVTVYDSLGTRHDLTVTYTPVDTDADGFLNAWTYQVTAPGDEVVGGTTGTPSVIASGTIAFDANGNLTTPSGNVSLTIPGWTNGAAPQTIDWRLYDANGAGSVTGYSGASATSSATQDGYSVGELRTLGIDTEGAVSGVFTNGVTLQLAALALANFNNPNGLLKSGGNGYLETIGSGPAAVGPARSGGRGSVSASSLELSNVDITQEFTDLIISERGYQANSRVITTTDQVIQEALNLKR
jgi:flagellar hook protein FlgE